MSDTSENITQLSAEKLALLSSRLKQKRAGKGPTAIPKRDDARATTAALSFAQQRLWFIEQLEPGVALYNIPSVTRLIGPLDVACLEVALKEVIKRHEVLRTRFIAIEGQPVQLIDQLSDVRIPLVDLSALPKEARERFIKHCTTAETLRPFDLEHGPLLRAILLRLDATQHVLIFTMHHIISDAWSIGVLVTEMGTLYAAFLDGQPSPLPELQTQYADYAIWQREWLRGPVLEQQLRYWREQIEGAPAELVLPADRGRPASPTHRGARSDFRLEPELTTALRELSQSEGVTLFMTLLSAWALLLGRHAGVTEATVGTPIAGRTKPELEELIGFFVNTLALRVMWESKWTVAELLSAVKETCLGAYSHQEMPFEKLVEELQPERSLSRSPLFQVAFILQNAPAGGRALPGFKLQAVETESAVTNFDLTLTMSENQDDMVGSLVYALDLFEHTTAARITERFRTLLRSMTAGPNTRLCDLPLLTEAERRQVLYEWNETAAPFAATQCVHQLFEAQVDRTPDAIALVFENQALTYRALNERANQLGHYLRELGVGPEVLVGLLMARSVEMVVSVLAVLKAGGAYLPLDPQYPTARLRHMLLDAAAPILLTQSHLADLLPVDEVKVVSVDAEHAEIARHNEENLNCRTSPDNAAYVIYTSGSTGMPKGVVVAHRGLSNLSEAQAHTFNLETGNRILQFSSFSFDASVFEMVMALLSGGTLYEVPAEELLPGPPLAQLLEDLKITNLTIPPSALATVPVAELPRLQTMIVAGEACHAELVEQWSPGRRFFNGYGPTETTIWATVAECHADGQKPRIGRPINNTQTYVLDEQMQPVLPGVAGQLYIGGAGVVRGYLHDPALTAERFVPDPFSGTTGARLYFTGDLARYDRNGSLEFVGRQDEQVKIRGYRVELGEIETVLLQHPSLRETVVQVNQDESGQQRLVAYLVLQNGDSQSPPKVDELRRHLRGQLPEYMIPGAFVLLDKLPLLPSGKVDRKALPAPLTQLRPDTETFVAPRTLVEEIIADIWADILNTSIVGVYDNFFDLGGHSLLVTQVIARVNHSFKTEVPLRFLFEQPTVAGLASRVSLISAGELQRSPLSRVDRDGSMPLSFAQQRLWFIEQLQPGTPLYNVPSAVRLTGKLDVAYLQDTLQEVIRRHEAFRTVFGVVEGQPVQMILPDVQVTISVVDLSALSSSETMVRQLLQAEAARPFDLEQGPLLRATLLRLDANEHVLLFTMHHIVSDAWSMGLLVQEVATLYGAFLKGEPSPLPELIIQYADYAVWQRDWLQGEVLEQQVNYWRAQLANAPSELALPTDHARPAVQSHRGATQRMALTESLTEELRELSRREGVTLFMTLLAAWSVLLGRYAGVKDVTVGTPIAGRTRAELEPLIGFFLNTLALRVKWESDWTVTELLQAVREVCLEGYSHQELPFEKLVEELQPERSLSRTPLFQVMLVLQNAPFEPFQLPGLELQAIHVEGATAKFDLTLTFGKGERQLAAEAEYNTDIFEAETITRMLAHLEILLQGMTADPATQLGDLPLLSEAEREQLLYHWNETDVAFPTTTIHELFEAQVERTPEAAALVFEDEQLTYRELNERANQLAHYLREVGVGTEMVVGLMLERSVEMAVSVLGVLKAGAAYLPLDPQYPSERLAFMLENTPPKVLITQRHFLNNVPEHQSGIVITEDDWETIARQSQANLLAPVQPDNLLYVIYTSGSTGRPKGIGLSHRALTNLIWWQVNNLATGLKTLQFASLSFDVSFLEMFAPWCSGGTLFVISEAVRLDIPTLSSYVLNRGMEKMFLPVVVLQQMAQDYDYRNVYPRSLKEVTTAGEQMQLTKPVVSLFKELEQCVLHNYYGPAETHVVTALTLGDDRSEWLTYPTIGRPIANTQIYILDERKNPAPVNTIGELFIGGVSLARGYLNDPELTAEKFIPDPFSKEEGARLYKTGDRARYLADGQIEFLGRIDHQIKIRGYRVEPAEIETILLQHPSVKETVVQAYPDDSGQQRLVAYVVVESDDAESAPKTDDLRRHLRRQLPEYMIPGTFVTLEELPLTPNGKVDRKALPAPLTIRPELSSTFVAPRTALERVIASIWADVLGLDSVGLHDNFFDLGGHSMLATKVTFKVRETLLIELPLSSLFESPTVESQVDIIAQLWGDPTTAEKAAETYLEVEHLAAGGMKNL